MVSPDAKELVYVLKTLAKVNLGVAAEVPLFELEPTAEQKISPVLEASFT